MKAFQQILAEQIFCKALANIIFENLRASADKEEEVSHAKKRSRKEVKMDRLIRRTKTNGTIIDLVYNAEGVRISKTVDGVETQYLTCSNNLTGYAQVFEELDSSGVIQKAYTYGLDLISQSDLSTGETHYYLYDGLGSVKSLVDELGQITVDYQYDAFGNLLSETQYGTTYIENIYRFTGEQYDFDLEMYFLRARYLDTTKGRFHSQDGFEGFSLDPISLHKYLYANANPVMFIDPSGKVGMITLMAGIGVDKILSGMTTVSRIRQVRRVHAQLCRVARVILLPYNKLYRRLRKLGANGTFEAHHIFKNADMKSFFGAAYSRGLGLAIPLLGGDRSKGSPHNLASQFQRRNKISRPTFNQIRRVALGSLRAAGCRNSDANEIIIAAENYLISQGLLEPRMRFF